MLDGRDVGSTSFLFPDSDELDSPLSHPPKEIMFTHSPRCGLALLVLATGLSAHAQTLDWGIWDSSGTGLYANGDSIVINPLVNGSVTPENGETSFPHIITDASFPFDNAPGTGEYGFFHNKEATTSEWSVLIDLSGFTLNSGTVIGFSNLDGRSANQLTPGYATIRFLDASGQPVSISSASLLGSFDVNWQGITWDADSVFNTATGRWEVAADSGGTHPAGGYFAAVGDAFFLTHLPAGVEKIVYTKSGTNYAYDSTLFYAGNAVPEPMAASLFAASAGFWCLRRRRGDSASGI